MEVFFLPASSGQRFCLLQRPPVGQPVRAAVVYVHPFAEEMNCSRGVVAAQARSLAAAGFAVLQIDLHGCGDSSGDFGDGRWTSWQADVHLACDYLKQQFNVPLWLWGLRAGGLLAAQVAAARPEASALLLWQPVWDGEAVLRHLLRLKLAASLLDGGSAQSTKALRARCLAGEGLEIAGYAISTGLAADLEAALWPANAPAKIVCLECFANPEPTLSPFAETQREQWQAAGSAVQMRAIACPAFWQTPGIEATPDLAVATLAAVECLA